MKPKYEMRVWGNDGYLVGIDLKGPEGYSVAEINAGDKAESKRIAALLVKALNAPSKASK